MAWLAIVELRRAWLRSAVAALAIALAILAVSVFFHQVDLHRAELLSVYEQSGAGNLVVELTGVAEDEVDAVADESRRLANVRTVEAPYNGVALQLAADVSFLVFGNERQEEYLGARISVLGVDAAFDLGRDYYVNFHDMNPNAPRAVLVVPLLRASGEHSLPEAGQVLAPSDVTNYAGVQPGTDAIVELIYTGAEPPIRRTVEGQRLVGTFDAVGPDQGRFDPFWRLAMRGQEVLTVRRPDAAESASTTTPVVLPAEVVRDFLTYVRSELSARGSTVPTLARNQLVITANSIEAVPQVSSDLFSLLLQHSFEASCEAPGARSFCVRMPERNNFQAALQEKEKLESGGSFFIALLLLLVAIGISGLEVQTIVMRWRDIGILQAVGFSRSEVLHCLAYQLGFVLVCAVAFALTACFVLPAKMTGSAMVVVFAGATSIAAAVLGALPVILWPLSRRPAELIRVAA